MRKETKPKVVCEHCGSTLKNEEYDEFCDYCMTKIIDLEKRRQIELFFKGERTDYSHPVNHHEFCSLKCARSFLLNPKLNLKDLLFIRLPELVSTEDIAEFLSHRGLVAMEGKLS